MQTFIDFRRQVEDTAARLGANRMTVLKWRERGIPKDWQIRLFEANPRRFKFSELAKLGPDQREDAG